MNEIIKVEGLTHIYDREGVPTPALHDINLTIKEGEFVAIRGPSGSGKTTLINIIAGLEKPTRGRVWVDGHELESINHEDLSRFRRESIGIVFQAFNLLDSISSIYNVELPMVFNNTKKKDRLRRAAGLLKRLGIEKRQHYRPNQLSGGEKQRVAIARALANDPKIILADEPTGNLDIKNGQEIMKVLTKINREFKKTVVLVTHDLFLSKFADRIIYLFDGRIKSDEKKAFFTFEENINMIEVMSENISGVHQMEFLFQMVFGLFLKAGHAERGSLMMYNKERGMLEIVASSGLDKQTIKLVKLKIGEGIAGEAYEQKKIVYVQDTSAEQQYKKVANIDSIKESLVSVPIIYGNEPLAAITISNTIKKQNPFEFDTELLQKIAERVSPIFSRVVEYQNIIYDSETMLFSIEYIRGALQSELKRYLETSVPFSFMLIKIEKDGLVWGAIKNIIFTLFRQQDIIGVFDKNVLACIFPGTPADNTDIIELRIKQRLKGYFLKFSVAAWGEEFEDTEDIIKYAAKKLNDG